MNVDISHLRGTQTDLEQAEKLRSATDALNVAVRDAVRVGLSVTMEVDPVEYNPAVRADFLQLNIVRPL